VLIVSLIQICQSVLQYLKKRQTNIDGRLINIYDDHVFSNVIQSYTNGIYAVLEAFITYALNKVHFIVSQNLWKSNICDEP
jgi:hypothetical protein